MKVLPYKTQSAARGRIWLLKKLRLSFKKKINNTEQVSIMGGMATNEDDLYLLLPRFTVLKCLYALKRVDAPHSVLRAGHNLAACLCLGELALQ